MGRGEHQLVRNWGVTEGRDLGRWWDKERGGRRKTSCEKEEKEDVVRRKGFGVSTVGEP